MVEVLAVVFDESLGVGRQAGVETAIVAPSDERFCSTLGKSGRSSPRDSATSSARRSKGLRLGCEDALWQQTAIVAAAHLA